jgi:hypothetical protein
VWVVVGWLVGCWCRATRARYINGREDIQGQQDITATVQEVSSKQVKGTKGNDGGAEEKYYRADLDITIYIEGDPERYFVDFTTSSIHTNKIRNSNKLRRTVSTTANEAGRLKVKHYEMYHEGRIVAFAQDSAGGLAHKAIQFTNFLYQCISNGISRGRISEQERIAHKKKFADTLSVVAAKHRVLDIIAMVFQTVDNTGNEK